MRTYICSVLLTLFVSTSALAVDLIEPQVNEDGVYTQEWFLDSFLDLKEDLQEAADNGKRFVVFFEQRGCIYCKKVHTEVLAIPQINAFVQENYEVVQLNLFGDREVTDFDGDVLSEKALARKWGVVFTPTMVFFPPVEEITDSQNGAEQAVATMPGAFGKGTFLSLFEWVKIKGYEGDEHFQKYVARRMEERRASGEFSEQTQ